MSLHETVMFVQFMHSRLHLNACCSDQLNCFSSSWRRGLHQKPTVAQSVKKFSERWRMPSSGMWRRVDIVWTNVSEERIVSIFRVEKSASEVPTWAGGCRLSHEGIWGRTYSHILNLSTSCSWVVGFTLRPCYPHCTGDWMDLEVEEIPAPRQQSKPRIPAHKPPLVVAEMFRLVASPSGLLT
jgi:hypothetical protein